MIAGRYMATAGFLSPRMKEREEAKKKKNERRITAEEVRGLAHVAARWIIYPPFSLSSFWLG